MDYTDKVCVITGGAGGIGRRIAESFLDSGAQAAVIDIDETRGQELADKYPGRVFFVCGDITQENVISHFAASVSDRFGHVDCLINNACVSRGGLLSGCGWDDFQYVFKLGVAAPYFLTLRLKDFFAPGASIVNISSTRAFMSQADTESYSAAKGGITALTHAMAASLAGRVRVNAVCPGWIDTRDYPAGGRSFSPLSPEDHAQHPAGRVGTPADIAEAVLFLCSHRAGFITGQTLTVDGGMTRLMIYHDDDGWRYAPPK